MLTFRIHENNMEWKNMLMNKMRSSVMITTLNIKFKYLMTILCKKWCVFLFSFSFIMHCDLWSMMSDQKQRSHTKYKIVIINRLKPTIFYSRNLLIRLPTHSSNDPEFRFNQSPTEAIDSDLTLTISNHDLFIFLFTWGA